MKIGVFAKTFPGTAPDRVLASCQEAGFQSAQYNMACSGLGSLPESISVEDAKAVAGASAAAGVAIAAISATYNMTDPNPKRRMAGRKSFAAIASRAKLMGTWLLTVCSGSLDPDDQWRRHRANDTPEAWADMCREFEILLENAEDHDILIGVEPEHANIVSSAVKAGHLLKVFSGSRIRIVLDPANLLEHVVADRQHAILDEAMDLLGSAVALVHVKDRDAGGRVVAAGKGIVNWRQYLCGLKSIGFDGHLVAHGMSAAEAPQVAVYLKSELERL